MCPPTHPHTHTSEGRRHHTKQGCCLEADGNSRANVTSAGQPEASAARVGFLEQALLSRHSAGPLLQQGSSWASKVPQFEPLWQYQLTEARVLEQQTAGRHLLDKGRLYGRGKASDIQAKPEICEIQEGSAWLGQEEEAEGAPQCWW